MSFIFARAHHVVLALTIACAPGAYAQAPAAAPAPATLTAPRPPLASFFENSSFSGAKLSPDAKYLAVKFSAPGRRVGLFVIDVLTEKAKAVAEFQDLDVGRVQWVNNERLVFNIENRKLGQRDLDHWPGLFAVNWDGSAMVQLADMALAEKTTGTRITDAARRLPWNTRMLGQRQSQTSAYIYVQQPELYDDSTLRHVELLRLNTLTGHSKLVKRPPAVRQWLLDNSGEPRLAVSLEKDMQIIYLRDAGRDEWRQVSTHKLYGRMKDTFDPLGFGPDGTLYVESYNGSSDTTAIHSYDLATGKISAQPIITTPGYDFNGTLITNHEKVLGMNFTTDAQSTMWFDDEMKALQKRIDELLPATVNLVAPAVRPETPWVLVESYSDIQPFTTLLFNTESGKFRKVGDEHPDIVPEQMGRQVQLSFKARDGMTIPALLTLPAGKRKDLPMVVLIHGGPWVRGSTWGWDSDSQFLASRGYAVLEPSFRGTTGLGHNHYKASFKQWGVTMQDDIADAAKFAIEKGYADPKRICLAGASYGGYATLMGLIKDPQLFKCGVNWVGVTDIPLMLNGHWSFKSDMTSLWRDYGAPEMIGDLVKDKALLDANSPLLHARKITQPLLLAYGGADARVPLYHGDKFYNAVRATNKDVEWIVYPEEGHGWALPKNSIHFWGRVEKFLDKHIGAK